MGYSLISLFPALTRRWLERDLDECIVFAEGAAKLIELTNA
jgi:hypothetical protein